MTENLHPTDPPALEGSPWRRPSVAALDDDALATLLRRYATPPDPADERLCEQLVESLCELSRSMCDTAVGKQSGTRPDDLPEQIGQYRILSPIGRGGMGHVYRALHVHMRREVALKVLPPDRRTQQAVRRFQREMELGGRLSHPNLAVVSDANCCDGVYFLVMELIDGLDLREVVRRLGPLSPADACAVALQAAHGLQAIHDHNVVHRDLKPSNLMLNAAGEVKILDLGLGLPADEVGAIDEELTGPQHAMGTPGYMAPEQRENSHDVDRRTDLFALGATLVCLLTGHPPKPDAADYGLPSDLPSELDEAIRRMLAPRPAERWASAADVAERLAPFAAGADLAGLLGRARTAREPHGATAAPDAAAAPIPTSRRDRLRPWLGVLLATVAAGLAAFVLTFRSPDGVLQIETDGADVRVTVQQGDQQTLRVERSGPIRRTLVAPYVDGPWVRLVNRMSDACLAPLQGTTRERASLHQYLPVAGDSSQHWRIESAGENGCRLRNRKSGLCVTLKRPIQGEGYLLRKPDPESREFLFSIEDIDGGDVRIVNIETGHSMGIWGAGMREEEWVIQCPFEPRATDRYWRIEPVPADETVWPSAEIVPPVDARRADEVRRIWCDHLRVPAEFTNAQGIRFRLIPPGELVLVRGPRMVRRPFYAGIYEVTQGQYAALTGKRPSEHGRAAEPAEDLPVENVAWREAAEFCNCLSAAEDLPPFYRFDGESVHRNPHGGYRLLTEDEWVYAASAGDLKGMRNERHDWAGVAWFGENSSHVPHRVGLLQPNPFGLFDVWGNVWEYVDAPGSFRGECYGATRQHLSVMRGFDNGLSYRGGDVGFRIAINVESLRKDAP